MQELIEILKAYGPTVAVLAYFCYRDYVREQREAKERARLEARITQIEDYQRDTFEKVVRDNTITLKTINETMVGCQVASRILKVKAS